MIRMMLLALGTLTACALATAHAAPAPKTKFQRNMVPDLRLPAETQWNHFSPELIPDFEIPRYFDPVLGTSMPAKILIWHNLGRGQFRTVTNGTEKEMFDSERVAMLKKGISVFAYGVMRPSAEQVPPGGNPTDPTGLPLDSLTQIAIGGGTCDDSAFRDDWDKWVAWWHHNVTASEGPLGASRPGKPSPICMTFTDYESTYTGGDSQEAANHLVVGMYAMMEKTAGYGGQMYLGPLNTCGNLPEDIYTGGSRTVAWFNPADDTVPEAYRGKKLQGNPRIVAGMEVAHYFETFLPEGFQAKDQNGKDFFVVTHFGEHPNTEHWAARVGGMMEGCHQYTGPAGQRLFAQLKIVCDRGSGFQYNPKTAVQLKPKKDGPDRWIEQFDRFGNVQPCGDFEYLCPIGSERVSTFASEAQMLLACFSGADGVNFWGAGPHDPKPKPKKGNPQTGNHYKDPDYPSVDFEPMNYVLKAFWRMAQKVTLENGKKYSFYDICDGTEEYLNWNTKVSYDGGKVFGATRALDWQLQKKTAVRAVVNRNKKVIFILAFQPYGVEQKQVAVQYNENGAHFAKTIDVPTNKVVMCAYELKGVKPVAKR